MTVTQQDVDPDTAALNLYRAIRELTEPGSADLTRDVPMPGTAAWDLLVEDNRAEQRTWTDVEAAAARRDRRAVDNAIGELDRLQLRREARTTLTAPLPSLLQQLQDAIPNSGENGGSSPGAGAARSPLAVAALDLVAEIATQAGARPGSTSLAEQLHEWMRRVCADETQVIDAFRAAVDWPERAHNVLDPPRRWTTPGACPVCKRTTAYVRGDDGETVRKPTIELDREAGAARCLNCKCRWEGETQLRQLAKVLQASTEQCDTIST